MSEQGERRRTIKLSCSFCGQPQTQTRKLVSGPNVHICADCIDLCHHVLLAGFDQDETGPLFTVKYAEKTERGVIAGPGITMRREKQGVEPGARVVLIAPDGTRSSAKLVDLIPVPARFELVLEGVDEILPGTVVSESE